LSEEIFTSTPKALVALTSPFTDNLVNMSRPHPFHPLSSLWSVLFCVLLASTAQAQRIIQVPGDAPTIQAGINMANGGDTVNVAPGLYSEAINFNGKSITVQGSASGVILDDGRTGPVVRFDSGETRSAVLQNVTVRNGSTQISPGAGGIYISGASPTIKNSTIEENDKCGIGIFDGAPAILNNIISNTSIAMYSTGCYQNLANAPYGGAIVLSGVSSDGLEAQIIGNTIENNQVIYGSAGIDVISAGLPLIENNIIRNNITHELGAGIDVEGDSAPLIVQNLIYNNTVNPTLAAPAAEDVGAGINISVTAGQFASAFVLLVNNTIAENQLLLVPGARFQGSQFFASEQMERVHLINNLIIGTGSQSAVDCRQPISGPAVQPPVFDHNNVYNLNGDGAPVYSGACPDPTGSSGNISSDPLFSSGVGDTNPFQLFLASPSVDAGDNQAPALPNLDILGQPRIQNAKGLSTSIVDMGVYEYSGIPGPPPPSPVLTLTATPTSLVLAPGQNGTAQVTVTPTSGILGTVLLSCNGLPNSGSCTLSPSLMTFTTTNAQSSVLTINVAGSTTAHAQASIQDRRLWANLAGIILLPVMLFGKRRSPRARSSRFITAGSLFAVCCMTAGITGCGKDNYVIIGTQIYQVTVQALAPNSGITKQVALTVTIH
jgi:hypothetical protein